MSIRIFTLARILSLDSAQVVASAAEVGLSPMQSVFAVISTDEALRIAQILRPDVSEQEVRDMLVAHPHLNVFSTLRKPTPPIPNRLEAIEGKLKPDQFAFLKSHGISSALLFDATGMSRKDYQPLMKSAGRAFAIGVKVCHLGHQSIRSRAGHCIQCNPARISYQLRHDATAYLYLAGSNKHNLLKIGCTGLDPRERVAEITRQSYGGINDWQLLLKTLEIPRAGEKEQLIHEELNDYRRSDLFYFKDGNQQRTNEIFSCSYSIAANIFRRFIDDDLLREF